MVLQYHQESETGGKKEEDQMWQTQKTQTDKDQDLRVVSWNVSKSSGQNDLLRNVAKILAQVAMFLETQPWRNDGVAEEIGWRLFRCRDWRKGDGGGEKEAVGTSSILQSESEMGLGCVGVHGGGVIHHVFGGLSVIGGTDLVASLVPEEDDW